MVGIRKSLILFLVIGAVLARVPLILQSMWYDEAFTVWLAGLPWAQLVDATAGDVHPPAWYFLAKSVASAGGGIYAIRILTLLLGLGAIGLTYQVLKDLDVPESVRWLAVWLACLSPFLAYYSAEARMYSLLLYVILLAVYNAQNGYGFPFGLSLLLGALTQNMFFLYVPFIGWIAWQKMHWKSVAWAMGAGVVYSVIWLPQFLGQLQNVTTAYWIPGLTPGRVVYTLYTMLAGPGHHETIIFITAPVLLLFVLAGAIIAWQNNAWNVLLLAFGPIVLGVVASILLKPVIIPRVMIGCVPFLLALIA